MEENVPETNSWLRPWQRNRERRSCSLHYLSAESWAGECWQIAGDGGQHQSSDDVDVQ